MTADLNGVIVGCVNSRFVPVRLSALGVPLAVAALQVGVAVLAVTHVHQHPGTFNAVGVLLLAVGPLALLERRRRPAAVLAFCFALALAYSLADEYPRGMVFAALVVAFWSAMMAGRRQLGWGSILGGYLVFVILVPATGAQWTPSLPWKVGIAAWMLLLGATAEIVRIRRERMAETAVAASEQARRVAGEERLAIARELHDVLAHHLSLINVQAGVALHLIDDRPEPEQTRAALTAIKQASKAALGELRSVLDVLRVPEEPAPRAPSDGLARLEQLIAGTQQAGVPVAATIEGAPRPLPPSVDLAAYRIVQEALTNVARHAAGAPATVLIAYREAEILVQVDNDGSGGTSINGVLTGGGNGIAGMRERATALGGLLEAGARPGGGFRVLARLPAGTIL